MRKPILLITTALLGLLLVTGIGKYTRATPIENNLEAAEVPRKWWNGLATLEMLGSLGLIAGLFWPPLMVLTAVCLVMYLSGAVVAHLRAGDANIAPSGIGAILAAILAVLHLRKPRPNSEI